MTDAQILAAIAPAADDRWRRLFGMPLWSHPADAADEVIDALAQCLYDLDVAVSFDWMTWYSPGRYPGGEGLALAPVAESVRMLASYLHGERVATGALRSGLVDGSILAAINRVWDWYRGVPRRRGLCVRRPRRILGRRHLPVVLRAAVGARWRAVLGRIESGPRRPRCHRATRAAQGRFMGEARRLRSRRRRQSVLAPIHRRNVIDSSARRHRR